MNAYPLTALMTLFTVLLMFATSVSVGMARVKYHIVAPAVTGHEIFERAYRAQMNTLEAAAMLLPSLWMFALYVNDIAAFVIGMVWLAGRIWYAIAYQVNPVKRGSGFGIGFLALAALWLGTLWKLIALLLQ